MLDTWVCKHTLIICDAYCFCTATVVAWTCLNVMFYRRKLPVLIWTIVGLLPSLSPPPPFLAHAWETFLYTCSAVSCPTSNFIKNCTLEIIFQPWLQINFCLSNCVLWAIVCCQLLSPPEVVFSCTIFTLHSLSQVVWLNLGHMLVYAYNCGTLQQLQIFLSNFSSCTCISCSVGFNQFEYCCKNKYCVK